MCVCVSVWPSQRSAQGFGYQSPQQKQKGLVGPDLGGFQGSLTFPPTYTPGVLAVPFRCCSLSPFFLTIPSACTQRRVSARLCAVWMPIGIHLGVHGGTDMTGRTHLFGHEYSSHTFVGRHKQQGADFHDSKHPNNHCQQQAKRSMSHPLIHFQQAMPWRDDVEQGRQRSRSRLYRTAVDCRRLRMEQQVTIPWIYHPRV